MTSIAKKTQHQNTQLSQDMFYNEKMYLHKIVAWKFWFRSKLLQNQLSSGIILFAKLHQTTEKTMSLKNKKQFCYKSF